MTLSPENILLIYGQGGMGKSTKLAQIAAHVYKTTGKKSRILGADPGGYKAFLPLMEKGILAYCPIDQWDALNFFDTFELITKGYWPENHEQANSPLLPPKENWRECPKCKQDVGAIGHAMVPSCKACGEKFGAGIRLPLKTRLLNGMEDIGFIGFEGATSFGDYIMATLRRIDPEGGRNIKDDKGVIIVSASGQQHYGDAQTYMRQFVTNCRQIPVPIVAWTALELRGNDDGYGKPVYGPKFPGKALVSACIPWFTDVLHLDGAAKVVNNQPIRDANGMDVVTRQLFSAKHYPADTKPYGFDAKSSAPDGGGMPLVLEDKSGQNTMKLYFEALAEANQKAAALLLG